MNRGIQVIWWGGWPWRWHFYYVRSSRFGPFGEMSFGPIGFTWPIPIEDWERPT